MRFSDAFPGIAALAGTAQAAQDLLFYQGMTFTEYKQALALDYTGRLVTLLSSFYLFLFILAHSHYSTHCIASRVVFHDNGRLCPVQSHCGPGSGLWLARPDPVPE